MGTATLATYSAGGFVANLGRDHNSSAASVARLLAAQWIDKRTRAVYLELLAYNPATSLYTVGRLSFEFFAGGGLLTGLKFESLQFDWYSKMNMFLVLCLQFGLIALVLVCFLTSLRVFCRQQLSFFKVCGALYTDINNILFTNITVRELIIQFYQVFLTNRTLDAFKSFSSMQIL